jgi:hypothetical protein
MSPRGRVARHAMLLRLGVEAGAVQTSPVLYSVVAERLQYYRAEDDAITLRVVPCP